MSKKWKILAASYSEDLYKLSQGHFNKAQKAAKEARANAGPNLDKFGKLMYQKFVIAPPPPVANMDRKNKWVNYPGVPPRPEAAPEAPMITIALFVMASAYICLVPIYLQYNYKKVKAQYPELVAETERIKKRVSTTTYY
eukprot:Platyproteum_vivax@DN10180_c0_g1_i1.p1